MKDDSISRQAAINAIENTECELSPQAWNELTDAIEAVQPTPVRHGQWFIGDDGALHCSKCSKTPVNRVIVNEILIFDMTPIEDRMKYCPNCGAKMDGEDGEHEKAD